MNPNNPPYNNPPQYNQQSTYGHPQYPGAPYPPAPQPYYGPQPQVVIRPKTNAMGTAGFVLALLAWIFCWVPVVDVILWILGLIFSVIGLFKAPRGLAIAGTVLSLLSILGVIVAIVFFGALAFL